jgi:hypothetical protein
VADVFADVELESDDVLVEDSDLDDLSELELSDLLSPF